MSVQLPVDEADLLGWVEVAHGSRLLENCLRNAGEPRSGSAFARTASIYPYESLVERVHSYLVAAVEHLVFWADVHVPLNFSEGHSVHVTLRPSYTLARAAIEGAAQAVWMMDTTEPMECLRRYLCLCRWDLKELRKSRLDDTGKAHAQQLDQDLVHRVSRVFNEAAIRPPNGYLQIIRSACGAKDLDLAADDAERIWRAASGAAHGKHWPTTELQRAITIDGAQPGQRSSAMVPDVAAITEALTAAHKLCQIGVFRYLDYLGADLGAELSASTRWLTAVIPLKNENDRDTLRTITDRPSWPEVDG